MLNYNIKRIQCKIRVHRLTRLCSKSAIKIEVFIKTIQAPVFWVFKDYKHKKKEGKWVMYISSYCRFNRLLISWTLQIIQSIRSKAAVTNIRTSMDINVFVNRLFLSILMAAKSTYFTTYTVIQLSRTPTIIFWKEIVDISFSLLSTGNRFHDLAYMDKLCNPWLPPPSFVFLCLVFNNHTCGKISPLN